MTKVEILGSDGWRSAGTYAQRRAQQLGELLRMSGAIVRVEGERPLRGRIRWRHESASGSWVGELDGIELFAVVVRDTSCTLYPALPGYRTPKLCDDPPQAADTAERVLDQFIMRMGVRGLGVGSPAATDTIELEEITLPLELAPPETEDPT